MQYLSFVYTKRSGYKRRYPTLVILLHIHMRNHLQHNKDEWHRSFEKYTSHFIESVVCERELETEQRLQNIDRPSSSWHSSVSFSFSLAAQPGLGSLLRACSHCSILNTALSSELQLLNWGSWGPPLLGAVLSTASYFQLTRTSCAPS